MWTSPTQAAWAIGSTEGCGTIAIHGGKVKGGGEVGIGGPGGRVTITGGSVTASQSNSAISGDHVHINGDAVVIAKSGTIDEGTADRKDLSGNDSEARKSP